VNRSFLGAFGTERDLKIRWEWPNRRGTDGDRDTHNGGTICAEKGLLARSTRDQSWTFGSTRPSPCAEFSVLLVFPGALFGHEFLLVDQHFSALRLSSSAAFAVSA